MKANNTRQSFVFLIFAIVCTESYRIASIDEKWICGIKRTCVECLQLDHCSWCPSTNACFSEIMSSPHPCNNTVTSKKYEMSLYDNAKCACEGNPTVDNCRPDGITEGPECYGRGTCACGRCFCDPNPDPENPSKVIIGEHCEFDNFSCDGPKCNEGPYSINELHLYTESNSEDFPETEPVEV